jgi:hypothetical protein
MRMTLRREERERIHQQREHDKKAREAHASQKGHHNRGGF